MDGITVEHPDVIRRVIAGEWLRADTVSPVLGSVTLRPHQLDAARRLRTLLADRGGALLCDEVGLGKTYVALALARSYERPLVVAPASLRDMWLAAARRSGIAIRFTSTESLSRARPTQCNDDLVIVDEAHHFRTPSAARYRSLAELAARSPILLVSATPLHNKAADMTTLLSLFLGSAARTLSNAEIAHYVVRRHQSEVAGAFPLVHPPIHLGVPHDTRHLELLLALPPPTPARDGGVAAAMVTHMLVRLWASSDATLREGLRRRLAKTVAIRLALEAGHYPTRHELEAWTYGDGSVQLGFAGILAPERYGECDGLLGAAGAHESALVELLASLPGESRADAARAEHIRALRREHAGAKIVAFSQFAETVAMVYRRLSRDNGVAMLTSRGARIASGPITRREALARFAPMAGNAAAPKRGEDISLLVATDLLSEGVNLQDASVVVHLDLPWTAATLEQRVGRVARLGSRSREVFVYAIDPPAPGRQLLRAEAIIRRKAGLAEASVGASRIPPLFARTTPTPRSEVEEDEAIRRLLGRWSKREGRDGDSRLLCAAIAAERDGVLALVSVRGKATLLAGLGTGMSSDLHVVRETADMAHGNPAHISPARIDGVIARVRQWMESKLASDDAGESHFGRTTLARRLTARLAQYLSRCPRHERARCAARIAVVQRRIQSPFTLGVEREIEDLLQLDSKTSEFLIALEGIIGTGCLKPESPASEIRALLVLAASPL